MIDLQSAEPVTDPSQTDVARARPVRRLVDRVLGSDPGFNRLRSAAMSVITIGLILAAETVFVRLSHGLQIVGVAGLPAAEAAKASRNSTTALSRAKRAACSRRWG